MGEQKLLVKLRCVLCSSADGLYWVAPSKAHVCPALDAVPLRIDSVAAQHTHADQPVADPAYSSPQLLQSRGGNACVFGQCLHEDGLCLDVFPSKYWSTNRFNIRPLCTIMLT